MYAQLQQQQHYKMNILPTLHIIRWKYMNPNYIKKERKRNLNVKQIRVKKKTNLFFLSILCWSAPHLRTQKIIRLILWQQKKDEAVKTIIRMEYHERLNSNSLSLYIKLFSFVRVLFCSCFFYKNIYYLVICIGFSILRLILFLYHFLWFRWIKF